MATTAGQGRESCSKTIRNLASARKISPGIILQIGLRNGHPPPIVDLDQHRQADQRRRLDLTQSHLAEFVFVGGCEALQIQREGGGIVRKIESCVFRIQNKPLQGRLPRQCVTEGDP